MTILYLDTSSSYLYTALYKDGIIMDEEKKQLGNNLSSYTLERVSKLFSNAHIEPKDLNKIIVVNGPGSFTGIRIGITIAKVMSWSMNIPITTISSLEAMSLSNTNKKTKVPLIDARRGYVYALIRENNKTILKEQYINFDELKLYLKDKDYEFITNDNIESISSIKYDPDLLRIIEHFQDLKCINPHLVVPNYLKLTEAEESKLN